MDIVRTKSNKKWKSLVLICTALVMVTITVLYWFLWSDNSSYIADRDTLLISQVQEGELLVNVRGIGVLAPQDVRWIATNISGKIERILVKAGAIVSEGDVIMHLSNPLLMQTLEETKWELDEAYAQSKALRVSLESEVLDQEAQVINEKLNYERSLLTLNAQKTLMKQGVNAVSAIDHEAIKIEVAQNKQRWELAIKRLGKQKENVDAQMLANQARLNRMQKTVERAKDQVDSLTVRASIDAIVQEMPMELGQQVNQGTNLARLAKRGEFIAELRVPENLIQDVQIGQIVELDTRTSKVSGEVQRIDPAVENGVVQVDIALTQTAPSEARPELTIEGIIQIAKIPNALFIQRPMFAKSYGESYVYLVNESGKHASKHKVTFGQASNNFIEIKSGLAKDQKVIVSDVSAWEMHQQIRIN
ncbi:efflux RND transporter periplasmic adaptor subunit [Glaciecola petra]|uniref:HlyD family efflux transporter periplasmic adaptor subunit n=1 Tax=Glaciecola petra TaxID=3075602 RepID=A0ABU2ZUI9_9ALTE|nr:HlyD family efflux transporter periplasmic adaptor subunit [Aestuariibacter sp. P117]MDT0596308.1 HlyD family efflux transporter periplasmic adaptor subunit [Aestuariibacter sp. P117]